MEEQQHPFNKLVDGIVDSERHSAEDDVQAKSDKGLEDWEVEDLVDEAKGRVLRGDSKASKGYEPLAGALLSQLASEGNPYIRVQVLAEVLSDLHRR